MRFGVISLFPKMFDAISDYGVTGKAIAKDLIAVDLWNPRDYTTDKHKTVDDRPYGGGPGMLMKVQPLRDAIYAAKQAVGTNAKVIYLSPQGKKLDHHAVIEFSQQKSLILLAGRYEGIDERLIDTEVDEQCSIGDYVLSGGELAAMVLIDAISRFIPGTLGHKDSAKQDSFTEGLLDCPHYTRPQSYGGMEVPEVLLSGNHKLITEWRLKEALKRTLLHRPDLIKSTQLNELSRSLLGEIEAEAKRSAKL